MQFLVTDIKFDFNTDLPDYYSVSEDDLVEEVTANAGWCILSIDYEIQLK